MSAQTICWRAASGRSLRRSRYDSKSSYSATAGGRDSTAQTASAICALRSLAFFSVGSNCAPIVLLRPGSLLSRIDSLTGIGMSSRGYWIRLSSGRAAFSRAARTFSRASKVLSRPISAGLLASWNDAAHCAGVSGRTDPTANNSGAGTGSPFHSLLRV